MRQDGFVPTRRERFGRWLRTSSGQHAAWGIALLLIGAASYAISFAVEGATLQQTLRAIGAVFGGFGLGVIGTGLLTVAHLLKEIDRLADELADLGRQLEPQALRTRTEADAAYYLAFAATTLPHLSGPSGESLAVISGLCRDLHLQLPGEEAELLTSASLSPSETERLSKYLLDVGKNLDPSLWCFFQLGNLLAWLQDVVKEMTSGMIPLQSLQTIASNPFLRTDARYANVVDALLSIFSQFDGTIDDQATRERLRSEVAAALQQIPPIYLQGRDVRTPVMKSGWFWLTDPRGPAIACLVGPYMVVAWSAFEYDVTGQGADTADTIKVTREQGEWHCSAHNEASLADPCQEIEMLYNVTEGGTRINADNFEETLADMVIAVEAATDGETEDSTADASIENETELPEASTKDGTEASAEEEM